MIEILIMADRRIMLTLADNMHFVAMFNFEDLMTLIDMNIREIGLSRVYIVNLVDTDHG